MSITQSQCNLLLGEYLAIKSQAQGIVKLTTRIIDTLLNSLNSMNDSLLDEALIQLNSYTPPIRNVSDLASSLDQAIIQCPALGYIFPQSVINTIMSTGIIAAKWLNKLKKAILGIINEELAELLGPAKYAGLNALDGYDDLLQKLQVPELLQKLQYMENCLVVSCGLISTGDRIYASTLNSLRMTGSHEIDIEQFASEASLIDTKLRNTFTVFKVKRTVA